MIWTLIKLYNEYAMEQLNKPKGMNTKEMALEYFNNRCLKFSGVHAGEFIDRDDFMAFINSLASITWFKCVDQMPAWNDGKEYEVFTYHRIGGAEVSVFYPYDNHFSRDYPSHWAYINTPEE